MVLESLLNPFKAEIHPKRMFLVGFLYSSVAILLSLWIFQQHASLVMVFLTVIASTPLIYNTIKYEEQKDLTDMPEKTLLKEHRKALSFFMYLFFGITLSCTVWYIFAPSGMISNLFGVQTKTIIEINSSVIKFGSTGFVMQFVRAFSRIFFNNLKVLIFCILFSFIYGMGAIFILTWNASVIGVAIGNFIRSSLAKIEGVFGFNSIATYFQIVSVGLLRYAIHGVPEILAYFTAGLAGGIISIAVIRHDFGTRKFEKIILDSSDLLLISFGLLFLAALLEVFVTPLLF